MTCDRCGRETLGTTGSMFNTQIICFDCKDREQEHPAYARAVQVEREAVERGNYNFEGVGLPADLR